MTWVNFLWYSSYHIFASDGAPSMIAADKLLKQKFPNLIHITCLAHELHRVAETIQNHLKNQFVNIKCEKSFCKSTFKSKGILKFISSSCNPPWTSHYEMGCVD